MSTPTHQSPTPFSDLSRAHHQVSKTALTEYEILRQVSALSDLDRHEFMETLVSSTIAAIEDLAESDLGQSTLKSHIPSLSDEPNSAGSLVYPDSGPLTVYAFMRGQSGICGTLNLSGDVPLDWTIRQLPNKIVKQAATKVSHQMRGWMEEHPANRTCSAAEDEFIDEIEPGEEVDPEWEDLKLAELDAVKEHLDNPQSVECRNRHLFLLDRAIVMAYPNMTVGSEKFTREMVPQRTRIWDEFRPKRDTVNMSYYDYLVSLDPRLGTTPVLGRLMAEADNEDSRSARLADGKGNLIDYMAAYNLFEESDRTGKTRQELMRSEQSERQQRLAQEIVAERGEIEDDEDLFEDVASEG